MSTRFQRHAKAAIVLLTAGYGIQETEDYRFACRVIQAGDCPLGNLENGLCTIDGDCACLDVEELLGMPTSERFVMPMPPDFGEEQWR
jgi:hypothetical protein